MKKTKIMEEIDIKSKIIAKRIVLVIISTVFALIATSLIALWWNEDYSFSFIYFFKSALILALIFIDMVVWLICYTGIKKGSK